MNNIHNFTNKIMCEYASIFPTVSDVLNQLLFTVGNGYKCNKDTGMLYRDDGSNEFIDQEQPLDEQAWNDLIAQCYIKERALIERFSGNRTVTEEEIAKECEKYKIVSVDDSAFTEESLYSELVQNQTAARQDQDYLPNYYLRPYPLSRNHSAVFKLNENTPTWFLEISLNFCNAWAKFLGEAIQHYDVKDMAEYEADYADMAWTTKHHTMILEAAEKIKELIKDK